MFRYFIKFFLEPSLTDSLFWFLLNNSFTKISFTDANGSSVVITDPAQFAGGKKTASVTSKPFHAKMETQVVNTAVTVQFTLTILVIPATAYLLQCQTILLPVFPFYKVYAINCNNETYCPGIFFIASVD